ncbi:hypothetical protein KY338_06020 [Candidatus Woesearchaeota archaeon]|nr:hypothetical protein [Candidatus Woesearchaeota archaeon]MBW3005877.1 hypothetical protein [Candidatus Woesearchaeota archaeon]
MAKTKSKFSIDQIKIPSLSRKKEVSELLNDLQQNKVSLTKESVSDIQEQILLREQLHIQILDELDKIKLQLSNVLLSSSDIEEQEKARIRQKQVDIEQFKIREKIDKWKDIAILKKELRDRLKEFKETESKTQLMSELLEE